MKKFMLISLAAASLLMGADIKFNEANQDVTRVSPLSDKNSVLSYYDSIAQAKLSVVNISTTKTVNNAGIEQMFNDPFFNEFFGFNFAKPKEKEMSSSQMTATSLQTTTSSKIATRSL